LLEDCKTSSKKNKGVTSMWLLSEKSMGVTMVAVQQGYLMVMQENVVTNLARKFFKKQQSKYFKQHREIDISTDNTILSTSFRNEELRVKNNCDLPCLSAMKTIVQCSKSFR